MRFSLKTLLIAITLFAVIGGVILSRANVQAIAISRILNAGGYVALDNGEFQMGSGYLDLPSHLGSNVFHSVTSVLIKFETYEELQTELACFNSLTRVVFIGDTSNCDVSKVQNTFPDAEIVDLSEVLNSVH